jgi:hypothetical protein
MKLSRWLLLGVFVLQVAVALLPVLPFLARALPENPNLRTILDYQITVFGIQFALLTAYLGITSWLYESASESRSEKLLNAINAPEIGRLREHDFYEDFLRAAKKAAVRVDIMYLALNAPDETKHEERRDYYTRLLRTIASAKHVRFRRIIRNSDNNRQWLATLLPQLAECCPNADIGILRETGKEEMPLSLSVQLIDSDHTWFVALETHEGSSGYRDVYVCSRDFNAAMSGYYERLWKRSDCVLNQGRLTSEGQRIIEEFDNSATSA